MFLEYMRILNLETAAASKPPLDLSDYRARFHVIGPKQVASAHRPSSRMVILGINAGIPGWMTWPLVMVFGRLCQSTLPKMAG